MKFEDVIDPKNICINITDKSSWGNGDIEIFYNDLSQLDDIMDIIMQSYKLQSDDSE